MYALHGLRSSRQHLNLNNDCVWHRFPQPTHKKTPQSNNPQVRKKKKKNQDSRCRFSYSSPLLCFLPVFLYLVCSFQPYIVFLLTSGFISSDCFHFTTPVADFPSFLRYARILVGFSFPFLFHSLYAFSACIHFRDLFLEW